MSGSDEKSAVAGVEQHMERLFQLICLSPETSRAVEMLDDWSLRDLTRWLKEKDVLSGVPGMLLGLCLTEAAERFERGVK